MIKLTKSAQKAIVAYNILQYIKNIKYVKNAAFAFQKDITENSQQYKKQEKKNYEYLQKLNNQISSINDQLINNVKIRSSDVEEQNYNEIINIFKLGEGLSLSQIPSKNQSILDAADKIKNSSNKKLVFYPTSTTVNLFNLFIESDRKSIIFGAKGIGKSISALLFCHLTAVITNFALKEDPQIVSEYVDINKFRLIPKIIYLTIEEEFTLTDIINQFKSQFPEEMLNSLISSSQQKDKHESSLQYLTHLVNLIKKEYEKKGIDLRIIIDQAQIYYRLAQDLSRLLFKKMQSNLQETTNKLIQKLDKISSYLKIIKRYIPHTFFMVNQEIKKDFFSNLNIEQRIFFNIDQPTNALRFPLHSKIRLGEQFQQIEMFLTLWFEIQRKLVKLGIFLKEDKTKQLYSMFLKACKVYYCNNWMAYRFPWTLKMTHLIIRQSIESRDFNKLIEFINKWKDNNNKKQIQDLSEQLQKIRTDVQCEPEQLRAFYQDFYLSQKDLSIKKHKFWFMMILSEVSMKYDGRLNYSYSNAFIPNHPDKQKDQYKPFWNQLIKRRYATIIDGVKIINHQPKALMYATQLRPSEIMIGMNGQDKLSKAQIEQYRRRLP